MKNLNGLIFFLSACASINPFSSKLYKNQLNYHNIRRDDDNVSEFSVKMIDLSANGDCTLITYGDTQILIDCGGKKQSSDAIIKEIEESMKDYPNDKIFDYLIFSHGDSDHIINFAGDSYHETGVLSGFANWIVKKNMTIGTFIDFDPNSDESNELAKLNLYTQDNSKTDFDEDDTNLKKVYNSYKSARDYLKSKGYITDYFTGSQCLYKKRNISADKLSLWKNNKSDEPKDSFTFADSKGEIKILNNIFSYTNYRKDQDNLETTSCHRNLLSTCCLITFDNQKYLFTGDLPEFYNYSRVYGETELVKQNKEIQDSVLFYKAAHHGSNTSNSDFLLSYIRPQYVGVSGVIDGQYEFPGDNAFQTLCLYTDRIYFTSSKQKEEEGDSVKPFDGTIKFSYKLNLEQNDEKLSVVCSNHTDNNSHSILSTDFFALSQSDDFKKKRFPVSTIELTSNELGLTPNNCTYVKVGKTDILINDGIHEAKFNSNAIYEINNNIDTLCNDHILDYLIITSKLVDDYSALIGANGLLDSKSSYKLKKIKNLIYSGFGNDETFNNFINNIKNNSKIEIDNFIKIGANNYRFTFDKNNDYGYVEILRRDSKQSASEYEYLNSFGVHINVTPQGFTSQEGYDYINLGHCYELDENIKTLSSIEKINLISLPHYGFHSNKKVKDISKYFYNKMINAKVYGILMNAPFGSRNIKGENIYPSSCWTMCDKNSYTVLKNTYSTKFVSSNNNNYKLDTSLSNNALIAVSNLPFRVDKGENLQYRINQNQGANRPFSMFNVNEDIKSYSKYRNSFLTYQEGNYKLLSSYLK